MAAIVAARVALHLPGVEALYAIEECIGFVRELFKAAQGF